MPERRFEVFVDSHHLKEPRLRALFKSKVQLLASAEFQRDIIGGGKLKGKVSALLKESKTREADAIIRNSVLEYFEAHFGSQEPELMEKIMREGFANPDFARTLNTTVSNIRFSILREVLKLSPPNPKKSRLA